LVTNPGSTAKEESDMTLSYRWFGWIAAVIVAAAIPRGIRAEEAGDPRRDAITALAAPGPHPRSEEAASSIASSAAGTASTRSSPTTGRSPVSQASSSSDGSSTVALFRTSGSCRTKAKASENRDVGRFFDTKAGVARGLYRPEFGVLMTLEAEEGTHRSPRCFSDRSSMRWSFNDMRRFFVWLRRPPGTAANWRLEKNTGCGVEGKRQDGDSVSMNGSSCRANRRE
jgi:hypothetical protein